MHILSILLFLFLSPNFLYSHIISQNSSFSDLALFDSDQKLPIEEDDLDIWHEKYMKYYTDTHYRILVDNSIMDKDALQGGGFVLYAFAAYYLFLAFYLLHKKFLHHVIEDLVYLIDYREYLFRPIVYCVLNSMSFLFICFFTVFDSNTNFAVSTVLGSDTINILFVFGVILYKQSATTEENQIDKWLYLRDLLYYLLGVGLLITFYMVGFLTWYFGLILVGYYIIFYGVQSKNDSVKEAIYKLLGFKQDDDSFNADEHFQYKKRRDSIKTLKENDYLDRSDQTLQKKLNRTEAILKINFRDNPKKVRIYSNFQKLVYIVMYAIRNKHKMEKIQRAQYYHNLHNKSEKKEKEKNYNGEPKEDVTPKANEEPYSQNNLSKNNLDRQSSNLNPINDNMPLLNQNEEMMKPAPNFNEVNKNESYEERAKNDDLPPNESNNFKSSGLENEDKKDIPAPMNLNNEDDEPEEEEVTLKCPEGFFNKIIYLFEFPILVCLFVLPNYKKNPSVKKLAFSLLLNLTLMGILLFFITRWLHVVSIGVNMNEQTMGFVFCSLGLSFPFIKYNFKIAASDKDVDFMQCFLQLGVYKIGVCIGLSWLFYCIVYLSNEINVVGDLFRFGVLEAVHGGILIFLLLVTLIKKFKYTSRISGIYLLCFVGFTIAGIILLQT